LLTKDLPNIGLSRNVIHRGAKAVVEEHAELAIRCQIRHRFFSHTWRRLDVFADLGESTKKPPLIQLPSRALFLEAGDAGPDG